MIDHAEAITNAWRGLRAHAAECEPCAMVTDRLRAPGVVGSPGEYELVTGLCPVGEERHRAWWEARREWQDTTLDGRRALGVLGMAEDDAARRDRAWDSMPQIERQRLLQLPADERFRVLESIEAGLSARPAPAAPVQPWRRPGGGRQRLEPTE